MQPKAMSVFFRERARRLKMAAAICWAVAFCALVAGIYLFQLAGPWKYLDGGPLVAGWVLGFPFNAQSRRDGLVSEAAAQDERDPADSVAIHKNE